MTVLVVCPVLRIEIERGAAQIEAGRVAVENRRAGEVKKAPRDDRLPGIAAGRG